MGVGAAETTTPAAAAAAAAAVTATTPTGVTLKSPMRVAEAGPAPVTLSTVMTHTRGDTHTPDKRAPMLAEK
jgi:hypothetical protein